MIVIPTGTDAPIYHWPYATVGLIALNVILAIAIPPVSSAPALDEDGEVVEEVIAAFRTSSATPWQSATASCTRSSGSRTTSFTTG